MKGPPTGGPPRAVRWATVAGVAVTATALATAARLALDPLLGDQFPVVMYILAIVAVAARFDAPATVATLVLGGAAAKLLFIPPRFAPTTFDAPAVVGLALYTVVGAVIVAWRRAARAQRTRAAPSRADAALRAQTDRLQLLLGHAKDFAVILTDPEGRVIEWSGGAERITGWAAAEVLGRPLQVLLFTPEDRVAGVPEREMATALREGQAADVRWHQRKDESRFFADGVLTALRDDAGGVRGFGKVFRDVTAAKRAEEVRESLSARLQQSEERLRLAQNRANIGVFDWDVRTRRLTWTPELEVVWGLEPGTVRSYEDFRVRIHPDDLGAFESERDAAIREHRPFDLEFRIVRPSGEVRWLTASGGAVYDADGAPIRVLGNNVDITDRKRAEEALRASERQLRLITDAARVGLVIVDEAHTYRFANRAYCEILGLPPGDLVGRRVADVLAPVYERQIRPRLLRAFAGERVVYELAVPPRPGDPRVRVRHCAVAYEPQTDPAGHRRVVVVLVDITVQKEAEEALRGADRRKDEFLATLAHELRNPLAPIRTGLEVFKRSPPGPAATRAQEMMERQLTHMVRLIDDLLDVSRISRGKVQLQRERVELRAVVEAAVETSRPAIDVRRHALTVTMPDEPVWLLADLTRLAQVFGNILRNAAKYTPEGGRIAMSAHREGGEVVVAVVDTGLGIPRAMLSAVFEMFAQVNRTLDRAQGGLGIGLALVKRLVEMHGGTVTAESAGPGQGSTFSVRLPAAPDVASPAVAPARASAAAHARGPGRRILVVDDNVDAAETLTLMLDLAGHTTRAAHSGAEALDVAASFRPDVLLCDIGMPGMNGYEVARRFRGDPKLARAVLVALTGWGGEEDKRQATAAGFDVHLTKPVESAQLFALLAALAAPGRT